MARGSPKCAYACGSSPNRDRRQPSTQYPVRKSSSTALRRNRACKAHTRRLLSWPAVSPEAKGNMQGWNGRLLSSSGSPPSPRTPPLTHSYCVLCCVRTGRQEAGGRWHRRHDSRRGACPVAKFGWGSLSQSLSRIPAVSASIQSSGNKTVWDPAHSCFPASRPCFLLPASCFLLPASLLPPEPVLLGFRYPSSSVLLSFDSNLNCCGIRKTITSITNRLLLLLLLMLQRHPQFSFLPSSPAPRNSHCVFCPVLSLRDTSGLDRDQERESGRAPERELTLTPLRAALSSSSDQSPPRPDQSRPTPASRLCLPARSLSHQSSKFPERTRANCRPATRSQLKLTAWRRIRSRPESAGRRWELRLSTSRGRSAPRASRGPSTSAP